MRLLIALSVAQLLAIGALIALVAGRSGSPISTASPAAPPRETAAADARSDHAIDEAELREIVAAAVREQLRADRSDGPAVPTADGRRDVRRDPRADRRLLERVESELQYYASVGSISPVEMEELQTSIAKLDTPDRDRMLRELVGALNDGRIDGRLY